MKNKVYNILIIFLLYLFLVCFPWNLINSDIYFVYWMQIITLVIYLPLSLYLMKRWDLFTKPKKISIKDIALLSPLVVICFSNYFYLIFYQDYFYSFANHYWVLLVLTIINVVIEEILFRYILLNHLPINNKLLKIVVAALIFALFHMSRFISSFNFYDLIAVAYSFGLGVVLGFIYEYGHSLLATIIFHFLFNFFNDILFIIMFSINHDGVFIAVSCVVALLAAIYLVFLYIFRYKKQEELTI